jgi:hypothetical protein
MAIKLAWQLTSNFFMAKIPAMGRPRKYGELPVNLILKIPVTSVQRALIQQATAGEPGGMAAWARAILLEAAKRKLAKQNSDKQSKT